MQNKNKKIKVAIIEPVGGHGGMDYYDYGLAYGLGLNDVEVFYHTCSETQIREFKNVNTYHTFHNLWDKPILLKLFYFLYYSSKAIRNAKQHKSDIIHFHFFSFSPQNLLVLLELRLFRLVTVVTVHDVDSFHGFSNRWVEKISYRLINGMIVHNQSSYNDLLKKKIKLPLVAIIPHGNYVPFVKKLPLPVLNDRINLLFFGQIKEVKGLDILLKAFAEVIKENKNFNLTIAGRPWKTGWEKYKQLISELEISDYVETHVKYINDEEVEKFYAKAHVVILPYKRIYQSGVLLLTMSYGRTAITSDLSAFKEIIENGKNGYTFKSEGINDLKRCILNLTPKSIILATNEAYKSMGQKFNWVNIGKQTKEFYNSL